MTNCKNCGVKVNSVFQITDFSGNAFCSRDCKTMYHNKIKNKSTKEKKMINSGMIKEIKCTCNECKHVWHYLESDEKRLKGQAVSNAMIGAGMCCNPFGGLFMNKSIDVSRELDKFNKCPKCNTSNINKEEKYYEKKY